MRKCKRCGSDKPLEAFPHRQHGTHLNICRDCDNARLREKYRANAALREERVAKARRYRAEHPDRARGRTNEQLNAKQRLTYAMKHGRIVRRPCVVCGDKTVHAHHHRGYAGPLALDVIWLCPLHHKEAHRQI